MDKFDEITLALGGWLNEYRTLPQIVKWLKFMKIEINEREFADYVEAYRNSGKFPYIESCANGYRFTTDKEAIRKSCFQRLNKGVSMIKHAKRDLEVLGEMNQVKLINDFVERYEANGL